MNKLKTGESFDLIVFQQIILKMTGMECLEDITDKQLLALSGGTTLGQEGSFIGSKVTKEQTKATKRLRDTLLKKDAHGEDMAMPMLILTAQQRASIAFGPKMENAHRKLIGELFDQSTETLQQRVKYYAGVSSLSPIVESNRLLVALCLNYSV
jgi:hypothetical protein